MECSRLFPARDHGARDGQSGGLSATQGRISTLAPVPEPALQSALGRNCSRDFERSFDLDRCVRREYGNADGRTSVATSSPNMATMRSDAPFITLGPSRKSGAELM